MKRMKFKREEVKRVSRKECDVINFADYAPSDKAYTKDELVKIYEKIIKGISKNNTKLL